MCLLLDNKEWSYLILPILSYLILPPMYTMGRSSGTSSSAAVHIVGFNNAILTWLWLDWWLFSKCFISWITTLNRCCFEDVYQCRFVFSVTRNKNYYPDVISKTDPQPLQRLECRCACTNHLHICLVLVHLLITSNSFSKVRTRQQQIIPLYSSP